MIMVRWRNQNLGRNAGAYKEKKEKQKIKEDKNVCIIKSTK
jgi:hypothetical protein